MRVVYVECSCMNNRYQLIYMYSKHSEESLVYSAIQCKFLGVSASGTGTLKLNSYSNASVKLLLSLCRMRISVF